MCANLIQANLMSGRVDVSGLLDHIERIKRSSGIMDRMITDLLDIKRIESGKLILKKYRCDIYEILRECKDLFAPIVAKKSLSMIIRPGAKPVFADIDHDRILQVLSNLIGNAIKFTPNQGHITLALRKTAIDIEVSVIDTGPGIPEQKRSQIFEKFSQVDSHDRRGLGLGLFISKWLIEAHKGRIWVDSEVGKGSTFIFTLPISVDYESRRTIAS